MIWDDKRATGPEEFRALLKRAGLAQAGAALYLGLSLASVNKRVMAGWSAAP